MIYPQLNIIVGIDANTYLQSQLANFRCYPNSPTEYTTYKKRTWLQPQISKADSLASVCRDHIICNMEFKEEKVTTILNENNKNRILIPTEKHPHDHFVVSLKVQTGRNEA